jgi:aarF domain-containing kinase
VAVSGSSFGFGATARVRVGVRGRIVVFVVVVPHPHLRLAPRVRRVPVARLSLDVPLVPAAAHDVARISSPRHARPSISSHRSASSVVRLRPRDRVVVVSFRFVSSGRCDSRNRVARRESRARRSRVVASRRGRGRGRRRGRGRGRVVASTPPPGVESRASRSRRIARARPTRPTRPASRRADARSTDAIARSPIDARHRAFGRFNTVFSSTFDRTRKQSDGKRAGRAGIAPASRARRRRPSVRRSVGRAVARSRGDGTPRDDDDDEGDDDAVTTTMATMATSTTMATTPSTTRAIGRRARAAGARETRARASTSTRAGRGDGATRDGADGARGRRTTTRDARTRAIREPEVETAREGAEGGRRGATQSSSSSSSSVADMKKQMSDVRRQMEEDEDLSVLMAGLRGTNIDASDFAADGVQMKVVDVDKLKNDELGDELPLYYDPELIANYWSRRPAAVAQRVAQLSTIGGSFITGIISDFVTKSVEKNAVKRAIQLREIVTSLGPAYIKLGQALSIRPDILTPAAMNELQKLCDKVPSFDNGLAFATLEDELGCKWQDVYTELGPEPVAAASLGQVYKGVLKETGDIVAVKVQRPAVLETVSIDLYVLRKIGMFLKRFPAITTDVVGLLDEWAARFFEELDYNLEGENQTKFAASIAKDLPQVVVPKTFAKYTRRKVITSEWLEGEKLSQSTADDVGDLVNIGVICYLKQLLDTGFFHADPHPGNLIRTPDGRLAILDFGLMTDIDDNIKYGMIEAISHLIHRDYEAIVKDFVTLDFIPEGTDLRPILPVLGRVFDQALEGGGAKNINFQELAADLAQITFDYPFRIPPYFALIIRAIGVLEGIALVGNPEFALVDEAYPYIAKRLLTDDSPRLREALRYMVYGKKEVFDADRMIDLLEALETFRAASVMSQGDPTKQAASPRLALNAPAPATAEEKATRDALQFVLSADGSFFREFLLDEAVKGIDALSRDNAIRLLTAFGLQNTSIPVFLPGFPSFVPLSPKMTNADKETLASTTKLLNFLLRGKRSDEVQFDVRDFNFADASSRVNARAFNEISPLLPAVATEIVPELARRLSSRVAARAIRDVFGGASA